MFRKAAQNDHLAAAERSVLHFSPLPLGGEGPGGEGVKEVRREMTRVHRQCRDETPSPGPLPDEVHRDSGPRIMKGRP